MPFQLEKGGRDITTSCWSTLHHRSILPSAGISVESTCWRHPRDFRCALHLTWDAWQIASVICPPQIDFHRRVDPCWPATISKTGNYICRFGAFKLAPANVHIHIHRFCLMMSYDVNWVLWHNPSPNMGEGQNSLNNGWWTDRLARKNIPGMTTIWLFNIAMENPL